MSENIKMEDLQGAPTSDATVENKEVEQSTEQDPLKIELEKVTGGRTEAEKAAFSLKKNAERVIALGGNPSEILGVKPVENAPVAQIGTDDDAPVTVGMLKQMQAQNAEKSALQLADSIANPTERELIKYHLENTIRSSGNPQHDFEGAQSIVNSVKNRQVVETVLQKPAPVSVASTGGAGAASAQTPEFTKDELVFMRPPFNLTAAEVIAKRPR